MKLQVKYKQQLALISLGFSFNKTSLNHLAHYLPFELSDFCSFSASLFFSHSPKKPHTALHDQEYICTL